MTAIDVATSARVCWLALPCSALCALAACGDSSNLTSHSTTNPATSPAQPAAGTLSAADDARLVELGATLARWNKHHVPDTARDPQTNFLPRTQGGLDRFTEVAVDGGRVYAFVMHFDPGTTDEATAKQLAQQEVPPDSRLIFDEQLYKHAKDADDQCEILQFQSAILAAALPSDPTGVILVTLSDETSNGFQPFDASSIVTINVLSGGTLGYMPGEC